MEIGGGKEKGHRKIKTSREATQRELDREREL